MFSFNVTLADSQVDSLPLWVQEVRLITGSDVHASPVCASGSHSFSFIHQPLNRFLFANVQNVSHRRCNSSCARPVLPTTERKPEGPQHFREISEQRSSNTCELDVSGSPSNVCHRPSLLGIQCMQ